MSYKEVFFHVPGDRVAVIRCLEANKILYKVYGNRIRVKSTSIYFSHHKGYGDGLRFDTGMAKEYGGGPIPKTKNILGWGDTYLSYKDQLKIFTLLKKAIMSSRKAELKEVEAKLVQKNYDEDLQELRKVFDFEKGVLVKEHQLEDQIKKTMVLIGSLQQYFSRAAYNTGDLKPHLDNRVIGDHVKQLQDVLDFLKDIEVETVEILNKAQPIQFKKEKKRVKIQGKHFRKLASKLHYLEWEFDHTIRVNIRDMQVTTPMRKKMKEIYTQILPVYAWYARVFKEESRKRFTN